MLGGMNGVRPSGGEAEARNAQLRQCARTVTACLTRDEQQIPDPWDLLNSSYSRDYLPPGSAGETRLQIRQIHVIPDILMAQFEGRECRCFMGLFAQIGRAWMTVDNRLFLWDFATGRDFTCFDELEQVIIDVALVKPKAGIFVSSIKYLLVVVTATEVTLLGVTFSNNTTDETGGDLIIHRTGLQFPCDEINMLAVCGSRTGRIFAGGQDGNLYEFVYQSEEGWFTRKCRKLNRTSSAFSYLAPTFLRRSQSGTAILSLTYDSGRNVLYSISEDSSIQAFYLGSADTAFDSIAHMADPFDQAQRLCPNGVLNRKGFKIVSINAVETEDSAFVHLVAITSNGIKLYFTTLKHDERAYSRNQLLLSTSIVPSTLDLVHVRLPAEEGRHRDARRMVHAWSPNIHTALYSQGVMLAASSISDQEDAVVASIVNQAVATSPIRSAPLESTSDVTIEGKVWEIVQVPTAMNQATERVSLSFSEAISPLIQESRNFLLLSNAGVYVVAKSTPMEELQKILVESNGNMEGEALRHYFEAFSPEQGCFLAVVLACTVQSAWKSFGKSTSRPTIDSKTSANLALWSVNAMMRYGGEPRIVETAISGMDYLGGVMSTSMMNVPAFGSRTEYEFSALHRGLYLYFARLVSGFWDQPITKCSDPDSKVLMALHAYGEFLERNPGLASRSYAIPMPQVRSVAHRDAQQKLDEAYNAENMSIKNLVWLVRATLELLSFLSICRDYNVLDAALKTSREVEMIEFEEVLASSRGRDLIADVGAALVQKQLKIKSSVDSLCQILLQRCPTFFGESEIMIYQGSECLERAGQTRDPSERNHQLGESLKMFLRGASTISLPILSEICQKYQRLAFFPGIIELCLATALAHDKENIALAAFRTPNLQLTTQQQEIVNLRDSIYALAFSAMKAVHGVESRAISAALGNIDIERMQKETLGRAVKSRDELFHLRMYDWLIFEHLGSLILDMDTPFVASYLETKFAEHNDPCKDMLWKYLARHGRYLEAAKILDQLTTSPEFHLNLAERIERLSLALGNSRSEPSMTLEAADYVQDLEERLDVAKLQNEILEHVMTLEGDTADVTELNCTLFDVSELFNRFARPLGLWESALRIIHCSSYQDPLLVHQFWTKILEKAAAGKRFDVLAQKLAELTKKLYPSPFAFPLMLNLAIKHEQPAEWVASTFLHSGVPVGDFLEQLVEFSHSQSSFWTRPENLGYLAEVFLVAGNKALDRAVIKSHQLRSYVDNIMRANFPEGNTSRLILLRERCK